MNSTFEDNRTLVIDFHAKINKETVCRFRNFTTNLIKERTPKVIYLALSSNGGENSAAFTLFNFLQSLDLKILTHCTGIIDSSAVSIFLAGSTRFIDPISRFLIHAPTWTFEAKTQLGSTKLKEYIQMMDWDQQAHETIMRDQTTASAEQIALWHRDGKILTADEALEHNFAHKTCRFIRPKNFELFSD